MALKSLTELVSASLKASKSTTNAKEVRLLRALHLLSVDPESWSSVKGVGFIGDSTVLYTLAEGAIEKLYGKLIPDFINQYQLGYMGLHAIIRLLDALVATRDPKSILALYLSGEGRYLVQLENILNSSTPMGHALGGLYVQVEGEPVVTPNGISYGSLGIDTVDSEAFTEWLDEYRSGDSEHEEHEWYMPFIGTEKANYGDFDALYAYLHCVVKDKKEHFVFNPTFRNGETNYKIRTEQMDMRYKDASSLTPYGFIVSKQFTNRYIRFFNHAGVELTGSYYSQAHALRSIYERFTGLPQTHQTLDWARTWVDEDSLLLNLVRQPQFPGDDVRLIAPNGFFYSDL